MGKTLLKEIKCTLIVVLTPLLFHNTIAQSKIPEEIELFFEGSFEKDSSFEEAPIGIEDDLHRLFIQFQLDKFNFNIPRLKKLSKGSVSEISSKMTFIERSTLGLKKVLQGQNIEGLSLLYQNAREGKKSKDLFKSFIGFSDLSFAYLLSKQLDSSAYFAELSYQEIIRQNKPGLQQIVLNYQADMSLYMGDLEQSIIKKLQVIQLASNASNDRMVSVVYRDIALISLIIGNYEQATQYANQLELFNTKINNPLKQFEYELIRTAILFLQDTSTNSTIKLQEDLASVKFSTASKLNNLKQLMLAEQFFQDSNYEECISISTLHEKEDAELDFLKLDPYFQRVVANTNFNLHNKGNTASSLNVLNRYYGYNQELNLKTLNFILLLNEERNELRNSNALLKEFLNQNVRSNENLSKRIAQLTEGNLREDREKLIEQQSENIQKSKFEKERLALEGERQILIVIVSLVFAILGIVILLLRIRSISSKQKQKEAELSQILLRSQMNPHFVFNAMSVIQSYIYSNDKEKSSTFLVNFSRLMRLILENSPKEMISLELEKEILDKYILTQKMRFQDRFEYELKFDQELIENRALIPPMIAQPFIENSIEHGQLHSVEGGKIVVEVSKFNKNIQLTITDNGIGRKASSKMKKLKSHKSMAIDITKERIQNLNTNFKVKSTMTINDLDGKAQTGTKVCILLPLKYD